MGDFHFIRPWWFIAFIPLALIIWLLLKESRDQGMWSRICDQVLLPHVLIQGQADRRNLAVSLIAVTAGLIIIACAGPAWQTIPQPLYVKKYPLVIALDVSQSMLVTDVRPNRLMRARLKLEDLLNERKDGQTALIIYTAHPFVVTPLTLDTKTIKLHAANLNAAVVPVQGSRPELALIKAAELLKNANVKKGQVLLITDNLNGTGVFIEARKLAADGFKTSVLIVGSKEGGPIPHQQGDFVRRNSKLVIDKVDEENIKRFINVSGGRYHSITADDTDLRYLLASEYLAGPDDFELLKLKTTRWQEQGPWLLLLVLPLAALAFRKGWFAVVIILIMPLPDSAIADNWDSLWFNKDQQGLKAFRDGEHEKAAKEFKSQQWKGAAYYRMGRYKEALALFSLDSSAQGFYNQGNALAKLGDYKRAIDAYREALTLDGKHDKARMNLKILEDFLNKQKKQQQQAGNAGTNGTDPKPGSKEKELSQQQGQNGNQSSSQNGQQNAGNNQTGGSQSQSDSANANPGAGQADRDILRKLEAEMEKARQKNAQSKSKKNETADSKKPSGNVNDDQPDSNKMSQSDQYMLQQLQDDPGMLLRRKFERQYERDRRSNRYPYLPTEPW